MTAKESLPIVRQRVTSPLFRLLRLAALLQSLALCAVGAQTRRPYAAAKYGGNYMHNYHLPLVGNSTPWGMSWSPDGRGLATSFAGSIWRVDLVTGAARQLTDSPKYHGAPDWSPDGRWIAYTADDGGKSIQMELVDTHTGEQRALTADDQIYVDPRFSPDGAWLAYTASKPNGYFNVFVRPIRDGAWAGDEIQVTADGKFAADRPYFTVQDIHVTPSWIRGSSELLLVSNRGVALGSGNIVRVRAVANGLDSARVVLAEQTLYQARPDVSPDGRSIVYSSARGGVDPVSNLFVRPLDGGESRRVTNNGAFDAFAPRWSPDGRSIAYVSNADGLPQLAVLDVETGQSQTIRITRRIWRRGVGLLRVRVVEGADEAPTPARIHLTAADGKFHGPVNAFARLTWAGDRVFQTSGEFSVELPVGSATLDVVKGFEFKPQRVAFTIEEGKTVESVVRLERVADMRARGWCGGSTGVHIHGGGPLRDDSAELLRSAAAEDLTFVAFPLAHRATRLAESELWIRGAGPNAISTPDRLLVYGQEHRPPFHGHVAEFGMRERLETLIPVTIGYEQQFSPTLLPTNTDILRRAKAQGAFTAYVHAFQGEGDPLTQGLGLGKAFPVDAALGLTDAIEWAASSRAAFVPWYAALNNGIKVAALGGEDTILNLYIMRLAGAVRTYAACAPNAALAPDAWFASAKAGKSFVTTGPLVELTVNGKGAGETVTLAKAGTRITVRGWVRSITPLQKILLVQNGVTVADIPMDSTRMNVEFTKTLTVARSGWIHLRAEGSGQERFPLDALYAQAFTNPIWLQVGAQPVRDRAAAEYALKWIDTFQLMADAWPGWTSAPEKQHLFSQLDEARAVYKRLAREDRRSSANDKR